MVKITWLIFLLLIQLHAIGQLKFIIEDFEGMADGQKEMGKEGLYTYGSSHAEVKKELTTGNGYSGSRNLKVTWNGVNHYGGFGKGITEFVNLNKESDHLVFYVYNPKGNKRDDNLRIRLEEDDNNNQKFEESADDAWESDLHIVAKDEWQFISIPLSSFKDDGPSGDNKFNISWKEGMLLGLRIKFLDTAWLKKGQSWYFDFFSISNGQLPLGNTLLSPKGCSAQDFCLKGAWSDAGYGAEITRIPPTFEKQMNIHSKLAVIHFFKPLASDGGRIPNLYPDVDQTNQLISWGYLPMITMELQYAFVNNEKKQPSLKEINSGSFDKYFRRWASTAKNFSGPVLLRVLHEFNGDWYPWCVSKNGNDPKQVVDAWIRIRKIFWEAGANNVKFVWCPNSRSFPQASWNDPLLCYPGSEYVDFVASDIYNGAGDGGSATVWRSFRKEGVQIYYELTTRFADKPFLVCEVSSRERKSGEGDAQNKAGWVADMSEALKTDFSKTRMISWFDSQKKFKVASSTEALRAYEKYIWTDGYFRAVPTGLW